MWNKQNIMDKLIGINEVKMNFQKSILTLALLSSTTAFASVVNLNMGDSITISANTPTTVTCGGAGTNCATPIKNLASKFEYCKSVGTNSIEECLIDIWPKFKKTNSSCIEEAYHQCLEFCKEDPFGLDCLKLCQ
jgi:hypothetical protein